MNDLYYIVYKVEFSGIIVNVIIILCVRYDSDCDGEWEEFLLMVKGDFILSYVECFVSFEV